MSKLAVEIAAQFREGQEAFLAVKQAGGHPPGRPVVEAVRHQLAAGVQLAHVVGAGYLHKALCRGDGKPLPGDGPLPAQEKLPQGGGFQGGCRQRLPGEGGGLEGALHGKGCKALALPAVGGEAALLDGGQAAVLLVEAAALPRYRPLGSLRRYWACSQGKVTSCISPTCRGARPGSGERTSLPWKAYRGGMPGMAAKNRVLPSRQMGWAVAQVRSSPPTGRL